MKNSSFPNVRKCAAFTYQLFPVIKNSKNHFKNRISILKDLWEVDLKFQENLITNTYY